MLLECFAVIVDGILCRIWLSMLCFGRRIVLKNQLCFVTVYLGTKKHVRANFIPCLAGVAFLLCYIAETRVTAYAHKYQNMTSEAEAGPETIGSQYRSTLGWDID